MPEAAIKYYKAGSVKITLIAHNESLKTPDQHALKLIEEINKLPSGETRLPIHFIDGLDNGLMVLADPNLLDEIKKRILISDEEVDLLEEADIDDSQSATLNDEVSSKENTVVAQEHFVKQNGIDDVDAISIDNGNVIDPFDISIVSPENDNQQISEQINPDDLLAPEIEPEEEFVPVEYEGYVEIDRSEEIQEKNEIPAQVVTQVDFAEESSMKQEVDRPENIEKPLPVTQFSADDLLKDEKFLYLLTNEVYGRALDKFRSYINESIAMKINEGVIDINGINHSFNQLTSPNKIENDFAELQELVQKRSASKLPPVEHNDVAFEDQLEMPDLGSFSQPAAAPKSNKKKRVLIMVLGLTLLFSGFSAFTMYKSHTVSNPLSSISQVQKENLIETQPVAQPPVQIPMSSASTAPQVTNATEANINEEQTTSVVLKPLKDEKIEKKSVNKPVEKKTTDIFEYVQYTENNIPIAFKALEINRIQLSKGETLESIEGKDTERWKVNYDRGNNVIQIKPVEENLSNYIIITTSKRKYKIKAVSRKYKANNLVKFQY